MEQTMLRFRVDEAAVLLRLQGEHTLVQGSEPANVGDPDVSASGAKSVARRAAPPVPRAAIEGVP
eukprot:4417137-Alexandrium_andersonii.AAC.1